MTEDADPHMAEMMARHRLEEAEQRVTNIRRFLFTVALSVLVFSATLWLPRYVAYPIVLAAAVFVAWGVWELRPGRCQVCGRKAGIPFPKGDTRPAPRPWWDIRSPSRKNLVWVCGDHVLIYLQRRVRGDIY